MIRKIKLIKYLQSDYRGLKRRIRVFMNPELVFIILNYLNYELTIRSVRSILDNIVYDNYLILVVDNNSPNESYKVLSEAFSEENRVILIKNNKNNGYSGGNNFGLKFIEKHFPECKYVAICNPDVSFFPSTNLELLINKLESEPELAAISPLQILDGQLDFRIVAWKLPKGLDDLILNFSIIDRIVGKVSYRKFKITDKKIAYVDVLPGSFFIIKFDVFKEIGFFDENTFLYCEERIVAKKLKEKGFKQALDFETFYLHFHGHKSFRLVDRIKNYNHLLRSRIYYNLKYNGKTGKFVAGMLYFLYPVSY
nr:putative rhamnosyl transferase [Thermotoga sp. RQ2]